MKKGVIQGRIEFDGRKWEEAGKVEKSQAGQGIWRDEWGERVGKDLI
ncbi:hypothetical protein [Alicyclobacillus shizuokensis]|nr:hypothetical protein [Alicyclobacillus shizuokensis]